MTNGMVVIIINALVRMTRFPIYIESEPAIAVFDSQIWKSSFSISNVILILERTPLRILRRHLTIEMIPTYLSQHKI